MTVAATPGIPPLQIYILKCDKSTKRLQLYRATYRRGFDSPVFDEQKTASGLNGKPCAVSKEFQGRPYTIGPAGEVLFQVPDPAQSNNKQSAPAADPVLSALKLFPWLSPVLFNPTGGTMGLMIFR